jgi:predicted ABC-type ATPase
VAFPELLDRFPLIVALAGPNGAGKSTFFDVFLKDLGLRFVNADSISRDTGLEVYASADLAQKIRGELVKVRESFVFETVFSDPKGEKIKFLQDAVAQGYTVVLCYIGLKSWQTCEERVGMRVSQGGHDVPSSKLTARYDRSLTNLAKAIQCVPIVYVYDNSDLAQPFRLLAVFNNSALKAYAGLFPGWFSRVLRVSA